MVYKQEFDFIRDIKFPKEIGITQNPKMLRVGSFLPDPLIPNPLPGGNFPLNQAAQAIPTPNTDFFLGKILKTAANNRGQTHSDKTQQGRD